MTSLSVRKCNLKKYLIKEKGKYFDGRGKIATQDLPFILSRISPQFVCIQVSFSQKSWWTFRPKWENDSSRSLGQSAKWNTDEAEGGKSHICLKCETLEHAQPTLITLHFRTVLLRPHVLASIRDVITLPVSCAPSTMYGWHEAN